MTEKNFVENNLELEMEYYHPSFVTIEDGSSVTFSFGISNEDLCWNPWEE